MDQLAINGLIVAIASLGLAAVFDTRAKIRIDEDWQRSIVAAKLDRLLAQRKRAEEARLLRQLTDHIVDEIIKSYRQQKKAVAKSKT